METRVCEICKEEFKKYPSYFKVRAGRFCSNKCKIEFLKVEWKTKNNPIHNFDNSGFNNPMFGKRPANFNPDGNKRKDGYIRVGVGKKIRVLKHRLIMEKHLGRKLTAKEIVHHVDGDNTNNDIKNLKVMSQREHIAIHRELLNKSRGNSPHSRDGNQK